MGMKRSLKEDIDTLYDLVVIGGGIHGAAIACHAVKAGFSTLLLEKLDFSGATSANSLKVLHGGLRYLQHLNIRRMRQSICSRREMMILAPHLVKPLGCLMPAYGYGVRGKEIMRLALLLNDGIGWDRNRGVDGDICLAGGRILDRENCLAAIPGLGEEGLRGGVVWHDALSLNTERLVLEYILTAADAGGRAANYAEVTDIRMKPDDSCRELTVHDRITGENHCVRSRYIVNAAGPWLDNIIGDSNIEQHGRTRYAMALNIVVNRPLFRDYAVALEGSLAYDDREALIRRGKRLYFFVPWRNSTMIGTNYRICEQQPDSFAVRREDVHTMVDEVNRIYGSADLHYDEVTFYHGGLLPISEDAETGKESLQLEKHSRIIDHDQNGFPGLISVRSVKYTTAPGLAGEVVSCLRKKITPSFSAGPAASFGEKSGGSEIRKSPCQDYLEEKYGRREAAVSSYLEENGGCEAWISRDPPLLRGEVEYCIAEEMALTLGDIVLRRTDLGTEKCPPADVLEDLCSIMAEELGWDAERRLQEIDLVVGRYSLLEYYDGERHEP